MIRVAEGKPVSLLQGLLFAAITLAVALGLRYLLNPWLGPTVPFATVFGAVALTAWMAGVWPAIFCAVGGYGIARVLFGDPTVTLLSSESLVAFFVYSLSCGLIIGLAEGWRRSIRQAQADRELAEHHQDQLAESHQRTARILESITDGFFAVDREWRYTYLNPRAESYIGRPKEELLGKVMWEEFPALLGTPIEKAYREAASFGKSVHVELESPLTGRWLELRVFAADDGLTVFFTDVTEQATAKRELEAKGAQLRIITEAVPALISYIDANGYYRLNNAAYEVWFGKPVSEVTGRHMRDVLGESAFERVLPRMERVLQGEEVRYEEFIPYASGGGRWVSATYSPDMAQDGTVRGYVAMVMDVSEQRQGQEMLRYQRELLETITQNAPSMLFLLDADGKVTFANTASEHLLGFTPSELSGRPFHDLLKASPDASAEDCPFREAFATGRAIRNQPAEFSRKGGGTLPTRFSLSPLLREDEVSGAVVEARDVSEQLRIEAERQALETRFETFMAHTPAASFIQDEEGRFLFLNRAAEAAYGWSRKDWYLKHPSHLVPKEIADAQDEIDRRIRATDAPVESTVTLEIDGEARHFLLAKFPIHTRDGKVHIGGKAFDVTERLKADEALRQSEARFQAFMDHSPTLSFIKNEEGRYIFVNHALEKIHGGRREDWYGKTDFDLFPAAIAEELRANDLEVIHDKQVQEFIETIPREPEDIRVLTVKFPIPTEDGKWFIAGTSIDVSERYRAEAALAQREKELREGDRRKDEFLATLAHELRNPLAPIRNAVQILKMSVDPANQARSIEIVERQLEHMVRLVDDLLEASRISRGKLELRKERTSLRDAVSHAISTIEPLIDSMHHRLKVEFPEEPLFVHGDPARLSQIFSNLLSNAAKYTEREGRIQLSVSANGGFAEITVSDNGVGIESDQLPNLFEMFWQAAPALERTQGGLGIGLSLVKKLVDLHEGTISVASDGKGKGSRFVVRLPLVTRSVKPEPKRAVVESGETQSGRLKVLVVDDNIDAAESTAILLQMMGHQTTTAFDGRHGLQKAESFLPDVVFLDIGLPEINGYEVARMIREQAWGKGMVLVALSGWGQAEDKERASNAGFDKHLTKPADFETVERLLKSLVLLEKA